MYKWNATFFKAKFKNIFHHFESVPLFGPILNLPIRLKTGEPVGLSSFLVRRPADREGVRSDAHRSFNVGVDGSKQEQAIRRILE
jgi:hypothetical protein